MHPALQKLKESGRYLIGALSNTIIFPSGHRFHSEDFFNDPLRKLFDVFISSAHVRVRKPDPKIYQLAVGTLDKFARENAGSAQGQKLGWGNGIKAGDILFFDDIGENLRAAKEQGLRTFKVNLGRAYEAVEELEKVTGLKLEGDHPKIPIKPRLSGPKARI
jgi:FMN phosphatase YigB (HAD superfamily)